MHPFVVTVFAVALAVSADAFLVGFSYGMKGLVVGRIPALGVALMSGLFMAAAILIGDLLAGFLGASAARIIGGTVLLLAAARIALTSNTDQQPSWAGPLSILSDPTRADRDHSGEISGLEALSLGVALSIDSLGVGVGVAMGQGMNLWLPLAASVATLGALAGGLTFGKRLSRVPYIRLLSVLPAIILALLGISRLLPGPW